MDASQRGNGLGTWINSRVLRAAFDDLKATHVYELVSSTNEASRRMVEACGLTLAPDLVCGLAVPDGEERYTR